MTRSLDFTVCTRKCGTNCWRKLTEEEKEWLQIIKTGNHTACLMIVRILQRIRKIRRKEVRIKIEIDTENTATVEGLKNLSNLVKEQVIEIIDKVKETKKEKSDVAED